MDEKRIAVQAHAENETRVFISEEEVETMPELRDLHRAGYVFVKVGPNRHGRRKIASNLGSNSTPAEDGSKLATNSKLGTKSLRHRGVIACESPEEAKRIANAAKRARRNRRGQR